MQTGIVSIDGKDGCVTLLLLTVLVFFHKELYTFCCQCLLRSRRKFQVQNKQSSSPPQRRSVEGSDLTQASSGASEDCNVLLSEFQPVDYPQMYSTRHQIIMSVTETATLSESAEDHSLEKHQYTVKKSSERSLTASPALSLTNAALPVEMALRLKNQLKRRRHVSDTKTTELRMANVDSSPSKSSAARLHRKTVGRSQKIADSSHSSSGTSSPESHASLSSSSSMKLSPMRMDVNLSPLLQKTNLDRSLTSLCDTTTQKSPSLRSMNQVSPTRLLLQESSSPLPISPRKRHQSHPSHNYPTTDGRRPTLRASNKNSTSTTRPSSNDMEGSYSSISVSDRRILQRIRQASVKL